MEISSGEPGRRCCAFLSRSEPSADRLHQLGVGGAVDGHEPDAYRCDETAAAFDDSGECDALEEGAAIDPVLDDVGDTSVELVEEQLKPAEHPRFDDGVCREGLDPADGGGAFGGGVTALSDPPTDPPELLLQGGVGVGAV